MLYLYAWRDLCLLLMVALPSARATTARAGTALAATTSPACGSPTPPRPRKDAELPVTFLMDRAGCVPIFPDVRGTVAKVYLDRAGAHIWRYPCHLDGHGKLAAAEGMLDLFGDTTGPAPDSLGS